MRLGAVAHRSSLVACLGATLAASAPTPPAVAQAPAAATAPLLLDAPAPSSDTVHRLQAALSAARAREPGRARALSEGLTDPVARKLVLWAAAASTSGSTLPPAPDASPGWAGWPALPRATRDPHSPAALWLERRRRLVTALRAADYRTAYALSAQSGLPSGPELAEAEFDAGWIALRKLRQPRLAEAHFARIAAISSSPISQARAYYWRGRTAETTEGSAAARPLYQEAARHRTTFYGQLAAEKIGAASISLGEDPVPSVQAREAFQTRELTQAVRLLLAADEPSLTPAFAAAAGSGLRDPGEYVLLIDLLRRYGRQFDSMTVARLAAQHGVILPQRAYPLRAVQTAVNTPFLLALIRQESGFDPKARSPAGARGMMQLLPGTARIVARTHGLGFSTAELDEAGPNIRIGSAYLGQLVSRFNGSYVMAAAGYNAGPLRLPEWVSLCGDPRSSRTDPVDFIECIPVAETRNYVMRVMEGMAVYRAKLAGGQGPITLSQDLARGTPG